MIAVLLLPIICLLVFRKDTGSLFRIRHTYLLLLLCIMYCVFFVVHQQFNMPGFYLFIQDLIIIGFSEEYLYRGVMYSIMKKENTALAIVLSSLFWGITHAVYPTVVVGGDLSVFLTDCISNIGFGLFIGYGFIYLKSRQNPPTSVVDEQVGDECSHISFHPCFLAVFHESFLKFLLRSWYNDVNKRRVSNMKSYRTYSSILSANHPQNPRLFCSYASC